MSASTDFEFAVIGGGVSGLLAAFLLSNQGKSVALIEPQSPGGLIQSRSEAGFTRELGAATLAENSDFRQVLQQLGLTDQVVYPAVKNFERYVWHDGRAEPLPTGPFALLRSRLFTPGEKWRAVRGVFAKLPADLRAKHNLSVLELFSGLFSPQIARKTVDPALRGIFGGNISALSASALFPELVQVLRDGGSLIAYLKQKKRSSGGASRQIFCLRGGNQVLTRALFEALSSKATIFPQLAIAILARSPGFQISLANGQEVTSRHCLISTSGQTTAPFIKPLSSELSQLLAGLRHAPIAVLHFAVERKYSLPKNGFGVLFPSNGDYRILGVLFNSLLFPHVAPPDQQLITVCLGGIGDEEVMSLSDQDLVALARGEIRSALRIEDAKSLGIKRWEKAIPQYEVSHEKITAVMRTLESAYPGLIFLGADQGGVGVPARISKVVQSLSA
ncbi:MAG: protoporphyrinogen oxidase [Oligoflexia bacterium]|nr:protoporphyrinogen oxidase [Oligoflexia bacterium]